MSVEFLSSVQCEGSSFGFLCCLGCANSVPFTYLASSFLPSLLLTICSFSHPSDTATLCKAWILNGKAADIFVDKLAWEGREGGSTLWPHFPELPEWKLLQVWQLWLARLWQVTYPIFSIQLSCSQVQLVQRYWEGVWNDLVLVSHPAVLIEWCLSPSGFLLLC